MELLFHLQGFEKHSMPSQECPSTSLLQDVVGSWLDLSQADTPLSELLGSQGTTSWSSSASGTGALSTSLCTVKPSQEKAGRQLLAKRVWGPPVQKCPEPSGLTLRETHAHAHFLMLRHPKCRARTQQPSSAPRGSQPARCLPQLGTF